MKAATGAWRRMQCRTVPCGAGSGVKAPLGVTELRQHQTQTVKIEMMTSASICVSSSWCMQPRQTRQLHHYICSASLTSHLPRVTWYKAVFTSLIASDLSHFVHIEYCTLYVRAARASWPWLPPVRTTYFVLIGHSHDELGRLIASRRT